MSETSSDDGRMISIAVEALVDGYLRILGPARSRLDAARKALSECGLEFEKQFRATNNPVWVWRCITRRDSLRSHLTILVPEIAVAADLNIIPPWCQAYLIETAYSVDALVHGMKAPGAERFSGDRFGPLDPKQAMERVPAALNLVRPGWNAFAEFQNDNLPRLYLVMKRVCEQAGTPLPWTWRDLMDAMGWESERYTKRKLAQLKREMDGTKGSGLAMAKGLH